MKRVKDITRAVKQHDVCLYAQETRPGRIDIYRKSQHGDHPPHFIMALTDTWAVHGKPVDWGIEVILNRIKAHDLWRDDTFVERWIAQHEAEVASQERARRNSVESFLYDFRRQFQRATNDVNTSLLSKQVPERKHLYGDC